MSPLVSVRVTDEEAARIARIQEQLAALHAPLRVSRSDALRAVLLRGIEALERKPAKLRREELD